MSKEKGRVTNCMKRLFVVGCSRSGTTVLQRKLCETASLFSLPETAYFAEELVNPARRFTALHRLAYSFSGDHALESTSSALRAWLTLAYWLPRAGMKQLAPAISGVQGAAELFVSEMDDAAMERGMHGWIEKTPVHCLQIDLIRELVRPDGFVFVLREGTATAASIRDRAMRFPERFGHQAPVQKAANLWNSAMEAALQHLGQRDVYFVSHEAFAARPADVTARVTARFDLVSGEGAAVSKSPPPLHLYDAKEPWKSSVEKQVKPQESKWDTVFTSEEQDALMQKLKLSWYRTAMEHLRENPEFGIAEPHDS